MAARKKKAVAKKTRGGLPVALQQRLESKQERFVSRERLGGSKALSIKNKEFRFDGRDLGDEIDVIMLDYVFFKQYFESSYDEKNPVPPDCFALADEELELKPLEDSPEIQGDDETGMCDGCWANEFESADTGGGKACQDRRRVALISAELFDEPDFLDTITPENVGHLTFGGTTLANWKAHTKRLGKTLRVAPFQVITTLSFDDSVKYEKLEFGVKEQIEDTEILSALMDLVDDEGVMEELRSTPDFSTADEPEEKPQTRRKKKKAPSRKKKKVARKKKVTKKKSRSRSKYS